jgi:REP element-mobilizing transposase RayT
MNHEHKHLQRLPAECYQGQAFVHWTMTMEDRKTGWLLPVFYYKFRELLTHTMFRYGLCCPIYCCMPDHMHFLWVGILDHSDQRNAAKYFRSQMNGILEKLGARFQHQPYEHVLNQKEREDSELANMVDYIARNPERAGLVPLDCCRQYQYTGCLMPGYPDLSPWQEDYWGLFWSIYGKLRDNGLFT